MSEAHNEHESVIKTPKQLIVAIVAAFVVPIVIIVLLTQYVAGNKTTGAGSAAQTPEQIAARLKPVADEGYTLKDANAPKQLLAGAEVYKNTCAACHDSGALNAPKTGVAAAWTARLGQGYDKLVSNAIKGIRAMPAKGGNADLDDVEVERAVVYMANLSGAKFKEPVVKNTAPAAAAAPAASTAPAAAAPAAPAPAPAAAAPAASAPAAPAKLAADAGKKTYEAACQVCHTSGAAGAPKLGDKAGWAPRIKQGSATLYEHAIKGFKAMPPKGGSSASDEEVKAAVDYMTATVK